MVSALQGAPGSQGFRYGRDLEPKKGLVFRGLQGRFRCFRNF